MASSEPSFTVVRTDKHVARVEFDLRQHKDGAFALLSSDRHHDNAACDRTLELEHLGEARDRRAAIHDNGDLFCAMQGKWDPRGSHAQTPAELERDDYSDELVRQASEFYGPFARNFATLAQGNHEDSINRRYQTNLTRRLVRELTYAAGNYKPIDMAYQGWVHYAFKWGKKDLGLFKMRFTHGYGGGGPVTKDTIQANRQLVFTEDCDILLSGHTHDGWYMPQRRHRTDADGKMRLTTTHCIKCPGYKDEFSDSAGWSVGKGHPPKPLGSWWVRFYIKRDRLRFEVTFAE